MKLRNQIVIEYLLSSHIEEDERVVVVQHGDQNGILQFRNKELYYAKCGRLQGNGAAMVIAGWKDADVEDSKDCSLQKKNVHLSLVDIEKLTKSHGLKSIDLAYSNKLLKEALVHTYSFRFKEAGAVLTSLLRFNRYDYTAWLWYARLLGKASGVESALGEAQKWGRHVKEIWEESHKINQLVESHVETIKRCHFCWAPLPLGAETCPYCNIQLSITKPLITISPNKESIKKSLPRFKNTFHQEPTNSAIAYVMSLGLFNLGEYEQALFYQKKAVENAPTKKLYQKALLQLEILCAPSLPSQHKSRILVSQQPQCSEDTIEQMLPNKKTVLVVEDSPTSQKVIKMVLSRAGLQTLNAKTGVEALAHIRDYDPDLILLDLMLPDMTGYDILPKIRAKKSLADVPVIMLTGKTGTLDRVKGLRAGSSEYLTKPFNPQKLIAIINKYL